MMAVNLLWFISWEETI